MHKHIFNHSVCVSVYASNRVFFMYREEKEYFKHFLHNGEVQLEKYIMKCSKYSFNSKITVISNRLGMTPQYITNTD